jgi:Flp pilus assembly protein TadG
MSLSKIGSFLRRFRRDAAGLAAIEFAFIGPVLITMYFGVAELTQAMLAQRRVAHASSTIGDLVAQGTSIQAANFSDLWTVGQTIISPFSTTTLKMRVTSVSSDANSKMTVTWSEGSGLTAYTKGQVLTTSTVPSSVLAANQTVIMSEVQYSYTSPVSFILQSAVPLNSTYFLRPRLSDSVTCSDC